MCLFVCLFVLFVWSFCWLVGWFVEVVATAAATTATEAQTPPPTTAPRQCLCVYLSTTTRGECNDLSLSLSLSLSLRLYLRLCQSLSLSVCVCVCVCVCLCVFTRLSPYVGGHHNQSVCKRPRWRACRGLWYPTGRSSRRARAQKTSKGRKWRPFVFFRRPRGRRGGWRRGSERRKERHFDFIQYRANESSSQ